MIQKKSNKFISKEIQSVLEIALSYHKLGIIEEAKKRYEHILDVYPKNFDALHLLGTIHLQKNNYDEALVLITKAIKLNSKSEIFYNNRGLVLFELRKFNDAALNYSKALKINSRFVEAYNNYAIVLQSLNQSDKALSVLNKAILINDKNASLFTRKGIIQRELGLFEESLENLNKAIRIDKTYVDAYFAKSLTLIAAGRLSEGWKLHEYRWKSPSYKSKRIITNKPQWEKKEKKKKILLWSEQGIGDEIMCSSLINELLKHCSKLIVASDKRLIPLYKRSFSEKITFIDTLLLEKEQIDYDFHLPIFSLPLHFKNDPNDQSIGKKYLFADIKRTQSIRKKIDNPNNKKIIGISWKSVSWISSRSFSLNDFLEYFNTDKYIFVNLQYGNVSLELENAYKKLGIRVQDIDSVDNFNDLDGLASLIEACDKIVSIDNITIHLAGALGKDTHVLLPYNSDYRWILYRKKSIWYDSLNLYWQSKDTKWENAFKEINNQIN